MTSKELMSIDAAIRKVKYKKDSKASKGIKHIVASAMPNSIQNGHTETSQNLPANSETKPFFLPPESHQFGQIEIFKSSYIWKIDNFRRFCEQKKRVEIKSASFSVGTNATKIWTMYLYPHGENEKVQNYVSIFVKPLMHNETEVQFRLSILNDRIKKVNELCSQKIQSPDGQVIWGIQKFINRNVLLDPAYDLLPHDSLSIHCEVIVSPVEVDNLIPLQKKLHNDLGILLENGKFSDLTLEVEGKEFKVHKNILSVRSPTFAELLATVMKPHEVCLKISEISCGTMRHILQFIYTEKVDVKSDIAYKLLIAASIYKLDDLKFQCQQVLSENLNIGNVTNIHVLANTYEAKWLKEKTMNFIIANARDIIDTQGYKAMASLYPDLLDEIYKETVKRTTS